MKRLTALFACAILIPGLSGLSAPSGGAVLRIFPDEPTVPLQTTLFGTNISMGDKHLVNDAETRELVKQAEITSMRFPNGCQADLYNWKSPAPTHVTVDEFMAFCEATEAEPYYTLNMQGGTIGLEGPVPEGATLDERIQYQHTAPNPCGYTHYHFGTLAETLELLEEYTIRRAREGKLAIRCYEMGNENWGQAFTDWTPDVYAKTVEVYASAMRERIKQAQQETPEAGIPDLYIVAVGFPVMGNNMKQADTPDRRTNIAWTRELNALKSAGKIDAVQEHFYPHGLANGGALAWAAHNLENILNVRRGIPNPRLKGYKDPPLEYHMPIEFTEWNVKCWGQTPLMDSQLKNAGFENGLDGWTVSGGTARVASWAARRGNRGLRVVTERDEVSSISTVITPNQNAKSYFFSAWIKAQQRDSVLLSLHFAEGEKAGTVINQWRVPVAGHWVNAVVGAHIPENPGRLEVRIAVDEPGVVYIDEAHLSYLTDATGTAPRSAITAEQTLFAVDSLTAMAAHGSPRSHIHHLAGNYPCGQLTSQGEVKDLFLAYQFFAGARGNQVVRHELECESMPYASTVHAWATDFNALCPNREDIPELAALASRDGDRLHVLLINRTTDRDIPVTIEMRGPRVRPEAVIRMLDLIDIDLPGVTLNERKITRESEESMTIPRHSARILSMTLAD